jgi:1-acyl-sn-glycerol-3-phosphate acyltransferase
LFFNIIYQLVALTIRVVFTLNGGFEVKGKENVPEGGVIVAANHISYLDPPLVGSITPRRATFMARKGLFKIRLLGTIIKPAAFPVDREKPRPSSIKEAVKRLKNGELIVIFPEGGRSETGELGQAKRGIGMIAGLSKVPIVPTLIIGSNKALPLGAKWIKRAKITVIFGKPINTASSIEEKGQKSSELHEHISTRIMAAIEELKRIHESDNS